MLPMWNIENGARYKHWMLLLTGYLVILLDLWNINGLQFFYYFILFFLVNQYI